MGEPQLREFPVRDLLADEVDFAAARPLPKGGFRYSGRLPLDVFLEEATGCQGLLVLRGPYSYPFLASEEGHKLLLDRLPTGLLDLVARTDILRYLHRCWPTPAVDTLLLCDSVTVLRHGRDAGFSLCTTTKLGVALFMTPRGPASTCPDALVRAIVQFPQRFTGHDWAILDDLGLAPSGLEGLASGLVQAGVRVGRAANLAKLTVSLARPDEGGPAELPAGLANMERLAQLVRGASDPDPTCRPREGQEANGTGGDEPSAPEEEPEEEPTGGERTPGHGSGDQARAAEDASGADSLPTESLLSDDPNHEDDAHRDLAADFGLERPLNRLSGLCCLG